MAATPPTPRPSVPQTIGEVLRELETLRQMINALGQQVSHLEAHNDILAAKVIKELRDEINKCPCNKEIIDAVHSIKIDSSETTKKTIGFNFLEGNWKSRSDKTAKGKDLEARET